MADKIHRLAVEGELHRPERTGVGDPNEISFSFLEDGQYYQDTLTGSLWRYDENDDAWYLLIDYDKQSQEIRNVNTLNAFQNNVGKTTEDIGAVDANVGTITSIPAYTYAQLREGEEIVVIDSSDDLNYIFFTVSADTNAGEVSIPVQTERTTKVLPEDSYIQMDASIIQSYFSVDPTKLEISFDTRSDATSFGYVSETFIPLGSSKSTLTISKDDVDASNPIRLSDNQLLQLQRRDGSTQDIIVNGDQTFTSSPFTLSVDTFTTEFAIANDSTFYSLRTYIVEPAYKSSSRITLSEGLIELNAQNISTVSNSVAGINAYVNSTFATLNAFTEFQTDTSNALTSINSTTDNLSASINTSVQYNDVGAYIRLVAGNTGSEIILQGNQINIDGLVTFINDESNTTINGNVITTGSITASQINVADLFSETIEVGNVIKSNNYVTGSSGFAIFANGEAEFRNVTVDGEIIAADGSQIDGEYVSNINAGTITVGTISADRIGANTISADKIDVADLFATNATVNGILTLDSGKLLATDGSNSVTLNSDGIFGVSSQLGTTVKIPTDGTSPFFSNGFIESTVFELNTIGVIRTSDNALSGDAGVVINADGLFAGSATQTTSNSNFRVSSATGNLVAQNATISGSITAGAGSSIDGLYVSNLNAGVIVSGSIDANVITVSNINASEIITGTIDADFISASNLESLSTNTGNLNVDGDLTLSATSEIKIDSSISLTRTTGGAGILGGTGTVFLDSQGVQILGTGGGGSYGLKSDESGYVTLGSSGVAVGFFGNTGAFKRTVSGSKGGNTALASLIQALVDYGLITDNTT